ncbi:MBL fold metallo-hydrolase [Bacillus taeanensis]|uniref:MBL fold metallo-hydrolase n=1 Tax=Bacillus taeanensis TaxID=273032 RepID=A0A366XZF1_9BACI|nr:MBL fold metallo-hydrolase [Bacillus taeanensis]RBW69301.1 MBL fold metallo-hydrolase [Bacillus taeanensis]
MKVTILGQWGGFPKVNGASSGYLFQHEGFNLLVDCGSAVLSKVQNYIEVEELDAVILSHYHPDHIADIGPLQHGRLVKHHLGKKQINLPIYGHTFNQLEFSRLTYKTFTRGVPYNPDEPLKVGPFTITFMKTKHPVDCYAMRITDGYSTVVYTADSSYLASFISFSKDADLFLCECNLYADMDGTEMGHMNSTDAAAIAASSNVKNLVLTHLPHFGELKELVNDAKRSFSGEVQLAEEGWVWET